MEWETIFRKGYRRTKEEKRKIHAGLEASRSFVKRERKQRGIQPLCKRCALKCKVLDGADSKFKCFDFVKNNAK